MVQVYFFSERRVFICIICITEIKRVRPNSLRNHRATDDQIQASHKLPHNAPHAGKQVQLINKQTLTKEQENILQRHKRKGPSIVDARKLNNNCLGKSKSTIPNMRNTDTCRYWKWENMFRSRSHNMHAWTMDMSSSYGFGSFKIFLERVLHIIIIIQNRQILSGCEFCEAKKLVVILQ